MKVCSKCNESKNESEFSGRGRSKDGLHTVCKSCLSKQAKDRRSRVQLLETFDFEKECSNCLETKPASQFYKSSIYKDRLKPICKECYKSTQLNYFKEDLSRQQRNLDKAKARYDEKHDVLLDIANSRNTFYIQTLSEVYLKNRLKSQHVTKEMIDQYPILIELKKAELLNIRLIKTLKNDNENQ